MRKKDEGEILLSGNPSRIVVFSEKVKGLNLRNVASKDVLALIKKYDSSDSSEVEKRKILFVSSQKTGSPIQVIEARNIWDYPLFVLCVKKSGLYRLVSSSAGSFEDLIKPMSNSPLYSDKAMYSGLFPLITKDGRIYMSQKKRKFYALVERTLASGITELVFVTADLWFGSFYEESILAVSNNHPDISGLKIEGWAINHKNDILISGYKGSGSKKKHYTLVLKDYTTSTKTLPRFEIEG